MRRGVLLACLAVVAISGSAQDRITVAKLEQRLAALQKRSDPDVAHRLQKLQLTQRLSIARLRKLRAVLPGPESERALLAVADLSEVLDLPPDEIPSDPPPSSQEQEQMLANAHDASGPSATPLPDFDATANITYFRNLKYIVTAYTSPISVVLPMPVVFSSGTDAVTYRDGRIFITQRDPAQVTDDSVKSGVERWDGLHEVLANVLSDMRSAHPVWTHWERGQASKLAVFRFEVSQDHAHVPIRTIIAPGPRRGFSGQPEYRAEIALDPTTGAVHRCMLRAVLAPKEHVSRADAVMEFGSVSVEGKTFLAPVRAVTIGVSQSLSGFHNVNLADQEALMNMGLEAFQEILPLMHVVDVEFTAYGPGISKPPDVADPMFLAAALKVTGERVTVEQLEKIVADLGSGSDADAAKRLGQLELTERLTADRYARMRQRLPGKMSADALTGLYDVAEFKDLPSIDLPDSAPPDAATQGKIITSAVEFVAKTTHKMPDLFATRELTRLQDLRVVRGIPQPPVAEDKPLVILDQSSSTVHFRQGREVVDTAIKDTHKKPYVPGLDTWGTFGPILEIVMADMLNAKVGWSHWEHGASEKLAVFRFAVPEATSHYSVRFCCYLAYDGLPSKFAAKPGYHGELAIDPDTGAILRLVLKADLKTDPAQPIENDKSPLLRSDVLVDYGAVDIAGKQYICPVRTVSVMTSWTLGSNGPLKHLEFRVENIKKAREAWKRMEFSRVNAINEAVFHDYHVFRSEMRIVSDGSEDAPEKPKQ